MSNPQDGLVSICMPTFNGGESAHVAVRSALDQDYPDLEVVVYDDGSEDGTAESLEQEFGGQIRLVGGGRRSGQSAATNSAVAHSHGSLIKFLHDDDALDPRCVSKLVEAIRLTPAIGMAFCRRRIALAEGDPEASNWRDRYADLHERFNRLEGVNRGRDLLDQMIEDGLHDNWIGEPSSVIVRRKCLERVGGFHRRVLLLVDLELWVRLMAHYDVAFVDEELVTYRHGAGSVTDWVRSRGLDWLDRLWMLESLVRTDGLGRENKRLRELWQAERRIATRTAARAALRRGPEGPPLGLWRDYVQYRIRRYFADPGVIGRIKTS